MPEIIKLNRPGTTGGRVPTVYPAESLNLGLQYSYDPRLDKGLLPGLNQEWNRSDNQSAPEHLLMGVMSRGLSIAPKVVAGLGAVGGLIVSPFNQDLSTVWDNPIIN